MEKQLSERLGGEWQQIAPARGLTAGQHSKTTSATSAHFFEQTLRVKSINVKEEASKVDVPFPLELLYLKSTQKDLQVDWWTLQLAVQQRLNLLRFVAAHSTDSSAIAEKIDDRLKTLGFVRLRWASTPEFRAALRRDRLSHFLLRLAFRNNPAAREWFITHESNLLMLRLQALRRECDTRGDIAPLTRILTQLRIPHDVTTSPTPDERHGIFAALPSSRAALGTGLGIFKVPFSPAANWLLRRKMVFVKGGVAYVPCTMLVEGVLVPAFVRNLWLSFDSLRVLKPTIDSDLKEAPSLASLLLCASDEYLGLENATAKVQGALEPLSLKNLERMCEKSFPPCMRMLFESLKKDHHLKHASRLELWLFLKSAGMTLDDQLRWWGSVWDDQKVFEKELRYNIRHAYGMEGKRTSYSCYNCRKIISLPKPSGPAAHGCSFAHMEINSLKKFLHEKYRVPVNELPVIGQLVNSRDYELACLRVFELRHGGNQGNNVGNHPLTWFEESVAHCQKEEQQK